MVGEGHEPPCGRGAGLVGATSFGDAMEVLTQGWAAVVADDRFERRPTNELGAWLDDRAPHDPGSIAMAGCQTRPGTQRFG